MPSCPQSEIVRAGEEGSYHCRSRCVRRVQLCVQSPLTDNNDEYRRQWITQFEERLAGLFGVEVGFHAKMSDHIHHESEDLPRRSRPVVR